MTFEEFAGNRTLMSVEDFCNAIGETVEAFEGASGILAYPHHHYIEVREDGTRTLIIGRSEWSEPDYTLEQLERILYDETHQDGEYVGI